MDYSDSEASAWDSASGEEDEGEVPFSKMKFDYHDVACISDRERKLCLDAGSEVFAATVHDAQGEDLPADIDLGWEKEAGTPTIHPFSRTPGLQRNPQTPLEAFQMVWPQTLTEGIVAATNSNAERVLKAKQAGDETTWKAITPEEGNVFLALVINSGIINRHDLDDYWTSHWLTFSPCYPTLMAKARFKAIFKYLCIPCEGGHSDLPISDKTEQEKMLHIVQPLIDSLKETFKSSYIPSQDIFMCETVVPFDERYNPKYTYSEYYSIKGAQVVENSSGYFVGLDLMPNPCAAYDPEGEQTAAEICDNVMRLCNSTGVLDKGHTVFMDEAYSSPILCDALLARKTNVCGLVKSKCEGMPQAVSKTKLTKGQIISRWRKGLLCLKWRDRSTLKMLSTLDQPDMRSVKSGRPDEILKPSCFISYCKGTSGEEMAGEKLHELIPCHNPLRGWKKIFIYLLNMALTNAAIIWQKTGKKCMKHHEYRMAVVKKLLVGSWFGKHCLHPIPNKTSGREGGKKRCLLCTFPSKDSNDTGVKKMNKQTRFYCKVCRVPLCPGECFKRFHLAFMEPQDPDSSPDSNDDMETEESDSSGGTDLFGSESESDDEADED